jgi:hypothetical protein
VINRRDAEAQRCCARPTTDRGWIHYKWTNTRGETYEKNLVVKDCRLAELVINDPAAALKLIRLEMPQLKTLEVFACGPGESPNPVQYDN